MKKDGSRTALSDRYREKIGLGLTSHNALAEANDDGLDFASIADAIEMLASKAPFPRHVPNGIERFERRELTRRLAQHLKAL